MKTSNCYSGFIEPIEDNEACAPGFLLMDLSRVFLGLCLTNVRLWFWYFSSVWGEGEGGILVMCWKFHYMPASGLVNVE